MIKDGRTQGDLLKRALLAIEDLQAKLEASERARKEPIAIVGMACRFPGGADDPEAFWRLLRDGDDAITEVPGDRWDVDANYDADPSAPGKMYTRHGGFLNGIDLFDPEFFGISPREAISMDPQQRLLLETSWQALENAGLAPERLAGSPAGVFIGISGTDYTNLGIRSGDATQIDPYVGTGSSFSVAAGRLAYYFGFQGPTLAVDTACSSSLVAVDLACQNLRTGRCNLALAGGVNLLLSPETTIYLCKVGAIAPDGHCKTFDAAADGYVRSEGCGVIVLKRLSDAQRDGDRILALVRGWATNHDGRTSGLTVPNGRSQQALIRRALAEAGVQPADIGYIEAHGTGTPLGDPIEVRALAQVFGPGRLPGQALAIGSVKTNLGHLEAAAGIAGLIKVVLALRHGEIPPHLHLDRPSPHIPWAELPIVVPTRLTPWPASGERHLAGVSSFGFSGTNTHVILEKAPVAAPRLPKEAGSPTSDRPVQLLALSAKSELALAELARRFADHLDGHPEQPLVDVAHTTNLGRSHHRHRLALIAADTAEARRRLAAFAAGEQPGDLLGGTAEPSEPPTVAFLFPGRGVPDMALGRELYETQPLFRQTLEQCDQFLREHLDQPLLTVLFSASASAPGGKHTVNAEPALFALEYSLAVLWRSWGIEPSWVLGHGVGELVAACVAGVMRWEDGLRLAVQRGRLMEQRPADGEVGPRAEPLLTELEKLAAGMTYGKPQMGWVSTVTGDAIRAGEVGPGYWRRQMRARPCFGPAFQALHGAGCRVFVEVGPGDALASLGQKELGKDSRWVASLRQARGAWQQLLESLGQLYVAGCQVDWAGLDRGHQRHRLALPTYPFQRQRYWLHVRRNERAAPELPLASVPAATDSEFLRHLRAAAPGEREDVLVTHLQGEIARVLKLDHVPHVRRGFFDMGMDSIMAAELKRRLEIALDKALPVSLVFDYPTIERMARYLIGEIFGNLAEKTTSPSIRKDSDEPIAVIGLGCRFPGGANDPEAFWQLLRDGKDAVGKVPADRWDAEAWYDPNPEAPGKMYTCQGGFLDVPVDRFDAGFFGITPREATSLDPQQRLLLEVSWEALENAGQSPHKLENSRTGVFMGINSTDYARLPQTSSSAGNVDAYAFTGNTFSVAAGRLSYILGLQGPCLAVDTSCSSSLVAVHLACQSLRSGECSLALAGGVNLMLAPEANVVLSRMHALAPDGRCKSFSAAADGYGRGEGAGVVLLKRLSDAVANGDNIRAVLLASAVNHDGPASGLTVPNGPAQQALLRDALASAKIEPAQVGYLEAHGTGTPLGDPIEIDAVSKVLCPGHTSEQPLFIGSAKANLGHLEAAAGIAGLVKVVLALEHGEIPPHLHCQTRSPYISWDSLPVVLPSERIPWPASNGPRIAGVSSFGMSGTNAHVLVQEAPACPAAAQAMERPYHLVPLSARSEAALRDLAGQFAGYAAANAPASLGDIAFTAATGRGQFPYRLAVIAASLPDLHQQLAAYVADQPTPGLVQARVSDSKSPKVAFLFPGQGSQYAGMGRELFETLPVFRQTLLKCDELLRPHLPQPLLAGLFPEAGEMDPTLYREPGLFAIEYALAETWRSWGIEPAWVLGQGVGEYVAACVAGALDLEEALRLVAARARHREHAEGNGVQATRPKIGEPRLKWFSSVTGDLVRPETWNADGWREAHQTLQVAAALQAIHAAGCQMFVEVGPGQALAEGHRNQLGKEAQWFASMGREPSAWRPLLETLARFYAAGCPVDWDGLDRGYPRRRLVLPTYPFQRQRYWWDISGVRTPGPAASPEPAVAQLGDEWLYQLQWQPAERSEPKKAAADDAGQWVILADSGEMAQCLERMLEARGQSCIMVRAGNDYQVLGERQFVIDPAQPRQWEQLIGQVVGAGKPPCRGLVHLWGLDMPAPEQTSQASLEEAQRINCGGVLHLVQALVKTGLAVLPRLWLITRGAQWLGTETEPGSPAQAALWGLGRVVRFEHPELWGGAIDLDRGAAPEEAARLFDEMWAFDGQDQVAYRDGQRWVARLARTPAREKATPPVVLRPDRTYLITGGLGSLGLKVAGWMIDQGARNLILTGRSGPTDAARESLAAWERLGARVVVARADVAQMPQLAAVFDDIHRSMPPLAGVIHAAGVLDDGALMMLDWARFARVMAPKVVGAWNLHTLTEGLDLDFFVMFSSMAALLGSPGQGNYAAANAFLDALAQHRRARGLPASSINWGPWADVGMAAELARRSNVTRNPAGVSSIPLDQGLGILGRLISEAPAQVGVWPVEWPAFLGQFPAGTELPVFADMARAVGPRQAAAEPQGKPEMVLKLAEVPAGERQAMLADHIRETLARVTGLEVPAAPEAQQGFFDMGLDSLMAIEMKNYLAASLGCSLPSTVVFQYPTIEALAGYLLQETFPPEAGLKDRNAPPPATKPGADAGNLEKLSEDELLAMLAEELGDLESRIGGVR